MIKSWEKKLHVLTTVPLFCFVFYFISKKSLNNATTFRKVLHVYFFLVLLDLLKLDNTAKMSGMSGIDNFLDSRVNKQQEKSKKKFFF